MQLWFCADTAQQMPNDKDTMSHFCRLMKQLRNAAGRRQSSAMAN